VAGGDYYYGESERFAISISIAEFVSQSKSVTERECITFAKCFGIAQRIGESVSMMRYAIAYANRRRYR
jgi:hypothetical protein